MVFMFQFVNMIYHIDWLLYTEESLHSLNKPNFIMVYELFDVFWILFAKILLRIFASMFISASTFWTSYESAAGSKQIHKQEMIRKHFLAWQNLGFVGSVPENKQYSWVWCLLWWGRKICLQNSELLPKPGLKDQRRLSCSKNVWDP